MKNFRDCKKAEKSKRVNLMFKNCYITSSKTWDEFNCYNVCKNEDSLDCIYIDVKNNGTREEKWYLDGNRKEF